MGTKDELEDLLSFCAATGVRPVIDEVLPLDRAREGFETARVGRPVRQDRPHSPCTFRCSTGRSGIRAGRSAVVNSGLTAL